MRRKTLLATGIRRIQKRVSGRIVAAEVCGFCNVAGRVLRFRNTRTGGSAAGAGSGRRQASVAGGGWRLESKSRAADPFAVRSRPPPPPESIAPVDRVAPPRRPPHRRRGRRPTPRICPPPAARTGCIGSTSTRQRRPRRPRRGRCGRPIAERCSTPTSGRWCSGTSAPETGSPFWLEKAKTYDFDPLAITDFDGLKQFPTFEDDWLRGGPVPPLAAEGARRQAAVRVRDRRHHRDAASPGSSRRTTGSTTNCSRTRCRRTSSRWAATG